MTTTLAELSPNESEVVNMRRTCNDDRPDSTANVCPVHGYAHQKQQGCVCVNNAPSISPNESQKDSPSTSRRIDERVGCDTAPVEAHTSRQLSCGYDCGHTDEQHQAFDSGVLAGEQGKDEDDCPYQDDELSEDWLSGHSVGVLNRRQVA